MSREYGNAKISPHQTEHVESDPNADDTRSESSPQATPDLADMPLGQRSTTTHSPHQTPPHQRFSRRATAVPLGKESTVLLALFKMLSNPQPIPTKRPVCEVKLAKVSRRDVSLLVGGLLYLLREELSEEDAIDKWASTYKAIEEMSDKNKEFKVTMIAFCKKNLGDTQKWAKGKLFVAAGLSIVDMITDVTMIFEYIGNQQWGFAWVTLGSLCFNLFLQSFVTFFQNRAKPKRRQLREQIYIWTLVKSGVDAFRLASGSEQEEGQVFGPQAEFTLGKTIELIAEAIPGTIIQLAAILKAGSKMTHTAIFSLAFSMLTAAFTSAITSWDWDVSKINRKDAPSYYGYIPDDVVGKIKVFVSLYCLSLFNLFVRAFACVLFAFEGGVTKVGVMFGGELLAYYMVKVARRDLWYWAPVYGVGGVITAFTMRWIVKIVTDWTAVVQFRHPNEVGGGYFTFSLFLTAAMGLYASLSYRILGEGGYEGLGVEGDLNATSVGGGAFTVGGVYVVWTMIGGCVGMSFSYFTLLYSINRKYVRTFFDWKTSNDMCQEYFTGHEEEEERFQILTTSEHKWKEWIWDDVKGWLNERLPVWLDEEPEWFTPERMSRISDELVDDPAVLDRVRTGNVLSIIESKRSEKVRTGMKKIGKEMFIKKMSSTI